MKLKRNDRFVCISLILTFVLISFIACGGIAKKEAKVVKQQQSKKDTDALQAPKEEEFRMAKLQEVAAAPPPSAAEVGQDTGGTRPGVEAPADFNTEEYGRIYENEFIRKIR